ncbi:MAG: hypothetical protein IT477_10310, partial [Rhodanobacteraceae bacterium]|nr:hypothetical protein [Rhodanobacteraceae bacterium]
MALRIPSQDRPGPRLLLKRYPFAFVVDEIAFVGTNMLTDTLVTAGVILATTDEFLALDIVPYDTSLAPSDNAMFQVIKHPPPLQENYQGAEAGEEEYEEFSYEPDMTMPDRWSVYVLDDEPADEEEEAVWPERDPSVTLEQVYAL